MKYLFCTIACLTLLVPVLFAVRPVAAQSIEFEVVYDPTASGDFPSTNQPSEMTLSYGIDDIGMNVSATAQGSGSVQYNGSEDAWGTYDFTVTWSGVTLNSADVSVSGDVTAQASVSPSYEGGASGTAKITTDGTLIGGPLPNLTVTTNSSNSGSQSVPSGTEVVIDCGGASSGSAEVPVKLECTAAGTGWNSTIYGHSTAELDYESITYNY